MRKGITVEFILCAVAVGLSVWAVIEARKAREGLDNDAAGMGLHRYVYVLRDRLSRVEVLVETHEEVVMLHDVRLSALEARCERVEDGFIAATAPYSLETDIIVQGLRGEIGVLRTTSGERPPVRHIETDEAGH